MNLMHSSRLSALALAALFAAGGAAAANTTQKPQKAAQAEPAEKAAPGGQAAYGVKLGAFFNEQHKNTARRYFGRYAKGKDCPEGMERTGKACAPPVQGRYWAVGQSLQKAVAVYPLPAPLLAQLPPAPDGYEYVRAGEDILLLSKAIHLVVDIIPDVMG